MTAVAYRAGLMACDSMWSVGSVPAVSRTKIRRLKSGILVGHAGDNDARSIDALLDRVRRPEDLPTYKELNDLRQDLKAMVVFPDGRIFHIECSNKDDGDDCERGVTQVSLPFWAIGCGSDICMGAMFHGHTAREAVTAACALDTACRGPIHSLALGPVKNGRKRKR